MYSLILAIRLLSEFRQPSLDQKLTLANFIKCNIGAYKFQNQLAKLRDFSHLDKSIL